jgi:hypothetical protein
MSSYWDSGRSYNIRIDNRCLEMVGDLKLMKKLIAD